ncbi:uncharacterized protein LOC119647167 [Hermetia illucens]|uniref:uncharacterized protein LOC119647167 n=1 Tax=Hermetia illucens TaxID=343691 RepID=UPI0018CC3AC8|nr:uncharacterized protein LOC119647167 [Hermetia illucens]
MRATFCAICLLIIVTSISTKQKFKCEIPSSLRPLPPSQWEPALAVMRYLKIAVPRDQIICIVKLPLVGQAYTVQYVSGGGAGYCIRSFWLKPNKENETSIPDCTA